MDMHIPLDKPAHPLHAKAFINTLKEVYQTFPSAFGCYGQKLESLVAQYCGSLYAFGMESTASAITFLTQKFGLVPGDHLLCSSYTSPHMISTLIRNNLTPIFVDVHENAFALNPELLEKLITPKTKGLLLSYPFGLPFSPHPFADFCKKNSLIFIENVESGLGSQFDHKNLGTFSDAGIIHFHPKKFLSLEEGCFVLTDRDDLIHSFQSQKQTSRMSDLNGMVGLWALQRQDEAIVRRKQLFERYHFALKHIPHCKAKLVSPEVLSQWTFEHAILLLPTRLRDALHYRLTSNRIQTTFGSLPSHLNSFVEVMLRPQRLACTEALYEQTLLLPMYPTLTFEEQDQVIKHIQEVLA